jgi:NhaP-type Na+/H+ or K+/H+ antiporter
VPENPYPYEETVQRRRRRGVDVFTLLLGLATLLVSAYVLTDGAYWLPSFDLRWALAGGAVLAGVLMLGASMRRR